MMFCRKEYNCVMKYMMQNHEDLGPFFIGLKADSRSSMKNLFEWEHPMSKYVLCSVELSGYWNTTDGIQDVTYSFSLGLTYVTYIFIYSCDNPKPQNQFSSSSKALNTRMRESNPTTLTLFQLEVSELRPCWILRH